MIRSAAGTVATRVIVMAGNLATVMAVGHALGSEGLGIVSLIVLGITFILLLNNVVGGGALTYLVPRHALRRLLAPAYLWAIVTAGIAAIVLQHLALVPEQFVQAVVIIALIQSTTAIHSAVLLGQERITAYNTTAMVQAVALPVAYLGLCQILNECSLKSYIHAAYIASAAAAIVAALMVLIHRPKKPTADHGQAAALRGMLRQGGLVQAANLLQLLNYRLAYYLIERWAGMASLGVYSVTTQLAESAWLGPKSLGTVLYARISNTAEREQQRGATIAILKGSIALATAVVLILLMVPDPVYGLVFGKEVKGVQPLLLLLVPGLLGMAASQAYSHYFSGVGLNRHNAIGSGIGLVCTLVFGYWLIPTYDLTGAAITASVAYSANALYQMVLFLRVTQSAVRDLLPGPSDIGLLRSAWRDR
jgi:O-antigen/teichoic acid export membrane protein